MPWLHLATLNVYSMSMQNSPLHKPIDIKISTVVAISVVLHSLDHATLTAALQEMTGGASDFFDNEFAVIDVGALDPDALPGINWQQLVDELRAVNLNPVAVRHAPASLHEALKQHGLSVDDSPKDRAAENAAAHAAAAESHASAHATAHAQGDASSDTPANNDAAPQAEPAPKASAVAAAPDTTPSLKNPSEPWADLWQTAPFRTISHHLKLVYLFQITGRIIRLYIHHSGLLHHYR